VLLATFSIIAFKAVSPLADLPTDKTFFVTSTQLAPSLLVKPGRVSHSLFLVVGGRWLVVS
jgi:hypothetical protein